MTSLTQAPPELTLKMSSAIVTLTKAICEAEAHNLKCSAAAPSAAKDQTLQSRLVGYSPTKHELQCLEDILRERLTVLEPRLAQEATQIQNGSHEAE